MESANRFLIEVYLPEWNRRFRREPASPADAHRTVPKDQSLPSILSYTEARQITNDYTLSWMGERFQIPLQQARPGRRKQNVRVEQRLDGSLCAIWRGRQLALELCEEPPKPPQAGETKPQSHKRKQRTVANHAWMKNFWHGDPAKRAARLPVTSVALRAPCVTGNP